MKKAMFISILLFHFFSYSQEKIFFPKKIVDEMNIMIENDQKYRSYISKNKQTLIKSDQDSLWKLQTNIDTYNINRLVQLIEEFGYFDSSNSNIKAPIFIFFMHTPKDMKDKVSNLIHSEYENGKIDKASYGMILWHLEGRPEPIIKYN